MIKKQTQEETLMRYAGRTLVDYARGEELRGIANIDGWTKDKAYAFIVSQMVGLKRESKSEVVLQTNPGTPHLIYAFDLRNGGNQRYKEVLRNTKEISSKLADTVIEEIVAEGIKNEVSGRGKNKKENRKWGYFITKFKESSEAQ
jgi:hypothetical protein